MALESISFLYPYAFALLGVYGLCERFCQKQIPSLYFSNIRMLQGSANKREWLLALLRHSAVLLMVIALANPVTQEQRENNIGEGYEILLALDASDSMKENARFEVSKQIVADFIDKRPHDRLALMVFATHAYVVVPFTYDKQPMKEILKYIELGVAGTEKTALYEALYQSGKLFRESSATQKIVILLTDGHDTKKNIDLDIAIAGAKESALRVYTIALGEKQEYDGEVLQQIAHSLGGTFYETNNTALLAEIYEQINQLEKSKIQTDKITQTDYYFQYPLLVAFALLMLLAALKRGRV